MMLMAASWPSNRLAAVIKRTGWVGNVERRLARDGNGRDDRHRKYNSPMSD